MSSSYKELLRSSMVTNKSAAPIQITAQQGLSEIRPPKQNITDDSELADYRQWKRKEFEDAIRRNDGVWVKYAKWEESQKDLDRARSVWERALEADYRNHTFWLEYAAMEMKNKCINHARNVWDRAVLFLPRVDQLWFKYIHMEEMIGNVAAARRVFQRWMQWKPDEQGWLSYIEFELRYNEIDRARAIYETFVDCHPKVNSWVNFAKFELKNGEIARARNCYERAVDSLGDDAEAEAVKLFVDFAEFEEWCKETERARCIYKFALDHWFITSLLPLRRSMEIRMEVVLMMQLWENGDFSMRMKLGRTPLTMILGSITFDWRKVLVFKAELEKFIRGQ